jgi:hypothetical protein
MLLPLFLLEDLERIFSLDGAAKYIVLPVAAGVLSAAAFWIDERMSARRAACSDTGVR